MNAEHSRQPAALTKNGNGSKRMKLMLAIVGLLLGSGAPAISQEPKSSGSDPRYTADGHLLFPEHYRDWVYLSSGFDMSYSPSMQSDRHNFDNVFVNPVAYQGFVATGHWPDGTVMVLEVRAARQHGSINRSGNFQGEPQGIEMHLRDSVRFGDRWVFASFDRSRTGKLIPQSADCYACHAAHAAVDTTFVQFYPTLLQIAQRLGTVSDAYLKESSEPDRAGGP